MTELRYQLTGADQCGPFLEQRFADAGDALRERDKLAPAKGTAYFVTDLDAVDGTPDGADHGEVDWCDGCLAEPVRSRPGEENLCAACKRVFERGES